MSISSGLKILLGLFYVCWIIGVVFQCVSYWFFSATFGIVFRMYFGFLMLLLLCLVLICLGFLVLVFVFLCLVYRFSYWKFKCIPFVPVKYPFVFGNISSGSHLAIQFSDFYKNYGTERDPIIAIHIFDVPMILIVDVELARSILTRHSHYFEDRGMYNNVRVDPLSGNLGSLDYEKWRRYRPILTQAFTLNKIKGMFPMMKKIGNELVSGLNEIIEIDNPVEIRGLFSIFATDIIGMVAIGIECDSSQLRAITQKAMLPYLQFPLNIFTIAHPDLARRCGIRKHPEEIYNFIIDIVKQTIEKRKQNEHKKTDFMQILIDANFTLDEIAALAFDFLSAGYADSTSTLSYAIYELSLAENEHIQQIAREEIQSVLDQNNGELSYHTVQQMKYIDLIIKEYSSSYIAETLRKHPVAGNISRIATKPFKIPNYDFTIPKGMRCFIPIKAMHQDERFFFKPDVFMPERFAENGSNAAFMPIGEGPRQCPGFQFANLLIRTGLVSLLTKYKFSQSERTATTIQYSATKNTLIPRDGIWVNVDRI